MNVSHFAWKASLRFALAIISILLPTFALCQSSLSDVIGVPPDAAMYPIPGLGSVNLNNGNLRLEIPIRVVNDRNGTPITTSITYDSSDWFVATFGTGPNNSPTYYWDVASTPPGLFYPGSNIWFSSLGTSTGRKNAGLVTYTTSTLGCGGTGGTGGTGGQGGGGDGTSSSTNQYSNWQFKDEQGTIHIFYPNLTTMQPNSACSGLSSSFQASAMDGSGYWLEVTNSTNWVVSDIHGDFVSNGGEDTNGNISGVTTDELGRSTSLPSGFTSTYKTIHVWTKFGNSTIGELGPLSAQVLDTLTLPGGRKYSFQYDDAGAPQGTNGTYLSTQQGHYGSLTGITLPTGGQVTINSEPLSLVIGQNPNSIYYPSSIVVNSITTPDGTWNFDYSSTTYRITATAPTDPVTGLASQTVNQCGTYGCNTYSQVSIYAGAATAGTLLRQVTKQYSSTSFGPSSITTKLDNGKSSTVAYTYTDTCTPRIATKKEYDFSGNLARETDVTYLTTPSDNTNLCSLVANKPAFADLYLQNGHHILDIPHSVTVYGPGGSTSTPLAQTNYTYDSTTLTATSGSVGTSVLGLPTHDDAHYGTSMTIRGNPTVISQMTIPGTFITTKTLYYNILGELVKSVDGNNNPTYFDYTDSWNDSSCISSAEFAYPTTVTNALGQVSKSTYNSCDGSMASTRDQNDTNANRAGTVYTYDGLQRTTNIALPDGGSTHIDYGGSALPEVITTTTTATPSPTGTSTTTLDVLGRTSTTVGADGATVATVYDALGRVHTVTNPYLNTSDPTYGITTYTYDPLGRTTIVMNVDGSKKQWCYNNLQTTGQTNCASHSAGSGTWVDVADENGNDWWDNSDVLGRLTSVFEPNGTSTLPSMETDYTYDALGNLQSIIQNGVSGIDTPRTARTFNYDGLSRLLCASNPENSSASCPTTATSTYTPGTTGYTYDANGNLKVKTLPGLNGSSSAQLMEYCYDALNRMTYRYAYSGAITCTTPYSIDESAYAYDGTLLSGSLSSGVTFQNAVGQMTDEQQIDSHTLVSERVAYNFDSMGRLKTEQQVPYGPASSSYTMNHTYDLLGNTKTGSNSATGITITNSFDAAARLTDVSSSLAASGSVTYPTDLYNVSSYGPAGVVQATYAGVTNPNTTGFFNLFRYYDRRMRLTDNELYASSDNFGTGTVAIIGGNATDSGWVDIQVGTITYLARYAVGDSALTVANAFATSVNHEDYNITANVPTGTYSAQDSSGHTVCQNGVVPNTTTPCAVVTLKAIVVGQYGDLSLSVPAGTGSSFASTPSNTTLIGGVGTPQGAATAYVYMLGYDRKSNIVQAFDAYNGSFNYGYDTLNRLTSAALYPFEGYGVTVTTGPNPGTYTNQCWSYDSFGNRLYELYTNTANPCPASSSNYSNSVQVDTNNHLTGINGNTVSRDASGNIIQDTLNNYIYDTQGRLCAVQNRISSAATQYVYDAGGNRVAKGTLSGVNWPALGNVCPAPTTANGFNLTATYLYGSGGQIDTELDQPTSSAPAGSWHQNVYGGNGLLATYTGQNGTPPVLYFNINDWLGTKRVELDTTGRATAYWKSDPFGSYLTQVGSGTDAAENHFTGKERDAESGNDYFGARYYASSMGRFMSPDPSQLYYADPMNPQTLNLYSYALNNPLKLTDPTGFEAACHWSGNDWDDTPENGGAKAGECEAQGGSFEDIPGPVTDVSVTATSDGSDTVNIDTHQANPGEMIPGVTPNGCPGVPQHLPYMNLNTNVQKTNLLNFYDQVKGKGPQDFKQTKQLNDVPDAQGRPMAVQSPYENYGNFNYGVVAATSGVPFAVALRAAGYAGQKAQGASTASAAKTAMGPAPYGDDPADQIQITNGYNLVTRGCYK